MIIDFIKAVKDIRPNSFLCLPRKEDVITDKSLFSPLIHVYGGGLNNDSPIKYGKYSFRFGKLCTLEAPKVRVVNEKLFLIYIT